MIDLFKKRKLEKRGFVKTYSRKKFNKSELEPEKRYILFTLMCIFIIWGVFAYCISTSGLVSVALNFVEGQRSNGNYYAKIDFAYEDTEQTELVRRKEAAKEPPLFSVEQHKIEASTTTFDAFTDAIRSGDEPTDSTAQTIIGGLTSEEKDALKQFFSTSIINEFVRNNFIALINKGVGISKDMGSRYGTERFGVIDETGRKFYYPIEEFRTPDSIAFTLAELAATRFAQPVEVQSVLKKVSEASIKPNLQFDAKSTDVAKQLRRSQVKPVMINVDASEVIILKGKILTKNDINKWRNYVKALSKTDSVISIKNYAKFLFVALLVITLAFIFINFFVHRLAYQPKLLLLFTLSVSLTLLMNLVVQQALVFIIERFGVDWDHVSFMTVLMPVALGTILMTLLVDHKAGLLATFLTAILAGSIRYFDFLTVLNVIFVGTIACMMVRQARNRMAIIRACIVAAIVNLCMQFPYLLTDQRPIEFYLHLTGLSVVGFTVLYFAVSVLLPVFEFLFGRTTNLSLLELCDLNHPLLQRLQMEAPGSYHHSLLVATIAEHAAKAVGANPLLTRVCAYFHDIGKIANSQYFTENNFDSSSKHDELKPKMSSLVIMNHVKEGVNLALRYKLKKPIIEAIEQHHGKSLVSFFYHLAKGDTDAKYSVEDTDFRYPGPLPRRKEIVILSIADPCEAASRSLKKPTLGNIEAMVNSIVNQRFEDGHFAEAYVTLKELEIIKKSIVTTLNNMLHTRVAYPKDEKEETNEVDTKQSGVETDGEGSGATAENSQ